MDRLTERLDGVAVRFDMAAERVDGLTIRFERLTECVNGLDQSNLHAHGIILARTDELRQENQMILDEVERVHHIMICRTDELKEKIG